MSNYSNSMRNHGKTFYWASKFLEKEIANRFYAVYEFCRNIDDLVDERKDKKELNKIIQTWNQNQYHDIFDPFKTFDPKFLPKEHLITQFFHGQVSDIDHRQPKTLNELILYCYRVAGVVGLMLCDVMELQKKSLRYFAIDLGIAMQLTNISRDIYEDAKDCRLYLPETMIGKIKLSKVLSPNQKDLKKINSVRNKLINLADNYYESANNGILFLPKKSQKTILIAANLYREIGLKIIKKNISYNESRVYLSKYEKFKKTLKILLKKNLSKKEIPEHNYLLHTGIRKLPEANNGE